VSFRLFWKELLDPEGDTYCMPGRQFLPWRKSIYIFIFLANTFVMVSSVAQNFQFYGFIFAV